MTVIYKAPGCAPEVIDTPNTLEALQEKVMGYIEVVSQDADWAIVCNEEGHLLGMPANCWLMGVHFVGPVLIVGVDGDAFTDVPDDMLHMFRLFGKELA